MMRNARLSSFLVVAILSPALLQPVDCNDSGDANLSSLELVAFGQNQVMGFSPSIRSYDVTVPAGVATLRATSVVPGARVNYTFLAATTSGGLLGFGGGEVDLDIPLGASSILISVTDGGTNATYSVSVVGAISFCGDGVATPPEECDDGNTLDGDSCSSTCLLDYNPGLATKLIPVVCSQNISGTVVEYDYELTVDPVEPVAANAPVTVNVDAKALIGSGLAGLTEVGIGGLNATVSVRSGATAPHLTLSRVQPFENGRCFVSNSDCTIDADCGQAGPCIDYIQLPVVDGAGDNCAACSAIGLGMECFTYGFCVDGPVEIPIGSGQMTMTPDGSGTILLGWNEDALPPVQIPQALGPNGASYWAGGLNLRLECYMGRSSPDGLSGIALLDDDLMDIPITTLPIMCGDGEIEPGEECDDNNTADGDGCAADCTLEPISIPIPLVCSNNSTFTPFLFEIAYTLLVDPLEPIRAGGAATLDFTGVATIPESLLDETVSVPGLGLAVDGVQASATVRSGAVGPDVLLPVDEAAITPGATRFCNSPAGQVCTTDGECLGGTCLPPVNVTSIPTSVDCTPGGLCDSLGKLGQCAGIGFCVTGPGSLQLSSGSGTFTVRDEAQMLLGWNEDLLPPLPVAYGNALGPNGSRLIYGNTIFFAYECYMGTVDGTGMAGVALPDSQLVSLPIVQVPSTCGDGIIEVGEECDDNNTVGGDGCAADCTVEPITAVVPVVCSSNLTSTVFDIAYTLELDPVDPVLAGAPFSAEFTGTAEIPEAIFDRLYFFSGVAPTEATLDGLNASVSVRSGASGPDVPLGYDPAVLVPGATRFCTAPPEQMCTSDGDCAVAPCLPPVDRIEIPTSTDCAPGGLCDSLGKLSTQCAPLGRCVTGGAQVVLTTGTGSFSTDTSGSVLVGWTEGPLPPFPVSYSDPVGPNGARINTGTVFAAYECWMGRANGGGTGGVALDDVELVSLPILN